MFSFIFCIKIRYMYVKPAYSCYIFLNFILEILASKEFGIFKQSEVKLFPGTFFFGENSQVICL